MYRHKLNDFPDRKLLKQWFNYNLLAVNNMTSAAIMLGSQAVRYRNI